MSNGEQQIATSVLVVGTGGSGLRAAIELAEQGVDVLVVGKRPKNDAHTALAAGGINAALATMDAEDTWQQHAADTLKESYLLADPATVQVVTEGAAESIEDLERYGMAFAREVDGRILQRYFGAHTFRRTAFAGDYTGLELQRTLIRRTAQDRRPGGRSILNPVRSPTTLPRCGFGCQRRNRRHPVPWWPRERPIPPTCTPQCHDRARRRRA
jgi:succinate dehydrogenase / fumarate reductase flavoprotein subunit